MQIEQLSWSDTESWVVHQSDLESPEDAQLVLLFSSPDCIDNTVATAALQARYPQARIVGGTTAGNILSASVYDDTLVATAVYLEKSQIRVVSKDLKNGDDVASVTAQLMRELADEKLRHVLVFSDGLHFNGSEIARAATEFGVPVTGGLMGDSARFSQTQVWVDGSAAERRLAMIGFYGDHLDFGLGCNAGWGEFGVDRIITRSEGNIVYEIDDEPALALYRRYLGEHADALPAAGLRFPLSIRKAPGDKPMIRTLVGVDEETQSLIFVGDMPTGAISLLMRGNIDNLLAGASSASRAANTVSKQTNLALLVSCVGRRLVLDQLVEEELESVQEELGANIWLTGFYSYGELAPQDAKGLLCELHNQTMTLTVIGEH